MKTIHRELLDGAPLPDIKVCDHIANAWPYAMSRKIDRYVQCANCNTRICEGCEDDAVICISGPHTICAECKETARVRIVNFRNMPGNTQMREYLCAPCCDRQDNSAHEMWLTMRALTDRWDDYWQDERIENLKAAIEKAEEAL
jgi:hypothetical protein